MTSKNIAIDWIIAIHQKSSSSDIACICIASCNKRQAQIALMFVPRRCLPCARPASLTRAHKFPPSTCHGNTYSRQAGSSNVHKEDGSSIYKEDGSSNFYKEDDRSPSRSTSLPAIIRLEQEQETNRATSDFEKRQPIPSTLLLAYTGTTTKG